MLDVNPEDEGQANYHGSERRLKELRQCFSLNICGLSVFFIACLSYKEIFIQIRSSCRWQCMVAVNPEDEGQANYHGFERRLKELRRRNLYRSMTIDIIFINWYDAIHEAFVKRSGLLCQANDRHCFRERTELEKHPTTFSFDVKRIWCRKKVTWVENYARGRGCHWNICRKQWKPTKYRNLTFMMITYVVHGVNCGSW